MTLSDDLASFLSGEIDASTFRHRDHVRLAFELLARVPFLEAVTVYAAGVREMAVRAGRPEAYHETITLAFLALISERRALSDTVEFGAFARANPDLFDKFVLRRWYDEERLSSSIARRTFVLPSPRLDKISSFDGGPSTRSAPPV